MPNLKWAKILFYFTELGIFFYLYLLLFQMNFAEKNSELMSCLDITHNSLDLLKKKMNIETVGKSISRAAKSITTTLRFDLQHMISTLEKNVIYFV